MTPRSFKFILEAIIISIISVIVLFLFAVVIRRIMNARKYRKLDGHRAFYRRKITHALKAGAISTVVEDLRVRSASLQWRAIEEILFDLMADEKQRREIQRLLHELGYKAFYESKLGNTHSITRATAVFKIGEMKSESSDARLVEILARDNDAEVLSVTVLALSKNGAPQELKALLERLPELYREHLVSQKTVEASLVNFGAGAVPLLTSYGKEYGDPRCTASVLEALSHLPPDALSLSFAAAGLKDGDAEVRARAVKVAGRREALLLGFDPGQLLFLLGDEAWFVRLQAAKALGILQYEPAVEGLGGLLLDQNWQVRNAAARALAHTGNASLDVFWNILHDEDRYAKESVCEEAGRTNFTRRLIENLMSPDKRIYEKSRDILRIMHSLNFSTPLYGYLENGEHAAIKREIRLLMSDVR